MSHPHSVVIIGSGPGIGSHVAAQFASNGFSKIALVARNPTQLEKDHVFVVETAAAAGHRVTVKTYPVDITESAKLRAVLEKVGADLGTPEFVFFNAARVKQSTLLEADEDEMIYDFKISTTSLHETAKWAVPQLLHLAKTDSAARPSLLVTSSHLPRSPEPDIFVLSLTKASQRNLADSMSKLWGPQGVHVGLVSVEGYVGPDKKVLNPKHIARKTWDLYRQERGHQDFEVNLVEE